MLDLLKKLCTLDGISGDEQRVAQFLYGELLPYADGVEIDPMGNVIALKRGASSKKKVLVAAHMDEVGLILKKVTDEGFLKFETVGGIDSRVLLGKRVYVGENRIPGVVGIKAIHLHTPEERKQAVKADKMYIDIGASSREEALKWVRLGDSIQFDSEFVSFGDGFVRAKALDDRAGCAILLKLIQQPLQYDTWFLFSVQEEIGLRGATVAAERLHPDEAYVVETTTCADFTGCGESDQVSRAGQGAVISVMDRSTIYSQEMVARAVDTAKAQGIPFQMKRSIAGGNDSGAIHRSGTGVKTLAISIPCRYLHSPSSVISLEDMNSVRELCAALICR
ncbi:MAG: M42 family metallopeptidase [Eubacteriales bacterium]|jgi:putative aminopeptidase FrvX